MSEDQEQKSIQLRALVAFALSAAILFLYQHFFVKAPPPAPPVTKKIEAPAPQPAPPSAPAAAPKASAKASKTLAAQPPGAEAAAAEQTFLVEIPFS